MRAIVKIVQGLFPRASARPVFAIILILAATSDGQEVKFDVASVTYLEGVARVRKPGSEGWLKIEESAIISAGDSLKTLADSRAEIILTDINIMRIGSSTVIGIGGSLEVAIESGEIWTAIEQAGQVTSMTIRSPVTIAEIGEAVARFSVGRDGSTEIKVYEGRIDLKILPVTVQPEPLTSDSTYYYDAHAVEADIGEKEVSLEASSKIVITSNGEIVFQGTFGVDDIDEDVEWVRWNRDRDQTGSDSDY